MSRIISNWPIKKTILINNFKNFTFQENDILWICDCITYETLDVVFSKSVIPKFVVGDNAAAIEYPSKIYTTVYKLELELANMSNRLLFTDKETNQCFNFLINKKQVNRYLLIKLVEYFKLSRFNYTWSGIGRDFDLAEIIKEWNTADPLCEQFSDNLRSSILSPISLKKFFVNYKNSESDCNVNFANYGSNLWTWNNCFKELMSECAVSLISESNQFEKSSVFTEKTLYSMFALTFPIFIGGYGHADQFKKMGFDNFEDVIDHSYQYKETLFERCYYAFFNNLKLLEDLEYVRKIRFENLDRLKNNREILLKGQLTKSVDQEINSWPDELTNKILPIYNYYRTLPTHYDKH
jgi:hypothetical protein